MQGVALCVQATTIDTAVVLEARGNVKLVVPRCFFSELNNTKKWACQHISDQVLPSNLAKGYPPRTFTRHRSIAST